MADRAWRLLQLAIEKARSALDGPLFCFLVQTGVENADRAWRLLQLAIEKARSALDGPLICFLVQTGVENGPFTLYGLHSWLIRQPSVWRSNLWSEGLDY